MTRPRMTRPALGLLVLPVLVWPLPAPADTALTADEFAARVEGRTLRYVQEVDQPFGAEYYGAGQRVIWQGPDGVCRQGHWYADAGGICFLYEDSPDPSCWQVFAEKEGLRAVLMNDPAPMVLFQSEKGPPLICAGPGV